MSGRLRLASLCHLFCLILVAPPLGGCASLSLPPLRGGEGPAAGTFPDAGAVVLQDVATLEFRAMQLPGRSEPRLVAVLDHRRRMKILREAGLGLADVRLPVDGYSTVTDVVARGVSARGAESWISRRDLQLVQREAPSARAADVQDLGFHIPGGEVGGILEYRYRRVYLDPGMIPVHVFGAEIPVMHAEFGLVTDPNVKLDYRYGHGDSIVQRAPLQRTTEDGRERLVFIETDMPAYFAEAHMPAISHTAPWISVALRETRLGGGPVRTQSWGDVGSQVVDDMVAVGGGAQDGNVRVRLESTRAALTPLDLPTLGARRPQSAAALLAGEPACTRDATAIALRALTGMTVQAGIVLLTGPDAPPVPEDFPTRSAFSRAAIALDADRGMLGNAHCSGPAYARDSLCGVQPGQRIFFDPLCTWCPFGTLPTEFGGSRALLIDGEGSAHWIDIPTDPPGRHSLYTQIKLVLDVDGSLKGDLKAEARGMLGARLRLSLRDAHGDLSGPAAIALARLLLGEADRPSTFSPSVDQYDSIDGPLTARAGLKAQAATDRFETFRMSPEMLAGSSIPAFWRGLRNTAAVVEGPWWKETAIEVTLPPGFEVTVPPPVRLSTPQADYAAGFVQHGLQLSYARRFVLKKAIVPAGEWADFHDFFETIRQAERMPVTLQMRP
jgi:hypothetical protein